MNPCYKCDDREVGCQITCPRRKEWLREEQEKKQRIWSARHADRVVDHFRATNIAKTKKEIERRRK